VPPRVHPRPIDGGYGTVDPKAVIRRPRSSARTVRVATRGSTTPGGLVHRATFVSDHGAEAACWSGRPQEADSTFRRWPGPTPPPSHSARNHECLDGSMRACPHSGFAGAARPTSLFTSRRPHPLPTSLSSRTDSIDRVSISRLQTRYGHAPFRLSCITTRRCEMHYALVKGGPQTRPGHGAGAVPDPCSLSPLPSSISSERTPTTRCSRAAHRGRASQGAASSCFCGRHGFASESTVDLLDRLESHSTGNGRGRTMEIPLLHGHRRADPARPGLGADGASPSSARPSASRACRASALEASSNVSPDDSVVMADECPTPRFLTGQAGASQRVEASASQSNRARALLTAGDKASLASQLDVRIQRRDASSFVSPDHLEV